MADYENRDEHTVFVGNLDGKVTEEILYELFLQAGPVKSVKIPMDNRSGRQQRFGFVTYKHQVSVEYAIKLLQGIQLYSYALNLSPKNKKSRNNTAKQKSDNSEQFSDKNYQHEQHLPSTPFQSLRPPFLPMHTVPPIVPPQIGASASYFESSFHSSPSLCAPAVHANLQTHEDSYQYMNGVNGDPSDLYANVVNEQNGHYNSTFNDQYYMEDHLRHSSSPRRNLERQRSSRHSPSNHHVHNHSPYPARGDIQRQKDRRQVTLHNDDHPPHRPQQRRRIVVERGEESYESLHQGRHQQHSARSRHNGYDSPSYFDRNGRPESSRRHEKGSAEKRRVVHRRHGSQVKRDQPKRR